jgi:hypothetical protein
MYELPPAIFKINYLSCTTDMEHNYLEWLIASQNELNKLDTMVKHNICNCVRSQVKLMMSWEIALDGHYNEFKSSLTLPDAKIDIIVQMSRDKILTK